MIQFTLKCDSHHRFESWFQSASAFDALNAKGHIACTVCGSQKVEKAVMAPRVTTGRAKSQPQVAQQSSEKAEGSPPAKDGPLSQTGSAAEQALKELRRKIETESDYVGTNFVKEARKMHDGETDVRSIHGEARIEDARKLIEDGVPVMPLPFLPNRKTN